MLLVSGAEGVKVGVRVLLVSGAVGASVLLLYPPGG